MVTAKRLKLKLRRGQNRPRFIPPKLPQTGKRKSLRKDRMIKAMSSGKRTSRRGKTYWETRRNRSDFEDDI